MQYQVEYLADMLADMTVLTEAHYAEIADHKDLKVLKPDYDRYLELEELGVLRTFTVRDDGKLIGYFITFITPHIHYSDCVYALNDIMYVHPDYRGGTVSYRLIKEALQDLRDNTDAVILCIHMKIEYPFRNLLKKFNFIQTEENWEVEL